MTKKVSLLSVLLVLGLTLLLVGCSSTNDVAQGIEGEGNVAVKLANTEVMPQDLDSAGIDVEVFNEDGDLIESKNIKSNQQSVKLDLPKGTYSIKAVGYNNVEVKDFNIKADIANGEATNVVVKSQENTSVELKLESLLNNKEKEGDVSAQAPAAPLDYVRVFLVESSLYGQESISRYQMSTDENHGGSQLFIYTLDVGYGYSELAEMNGSSASVEKVYEELLDLDNDGIIDSRAKVWDASGYESGRFYYENTSTNSPWNTESTTLYIR
ncbi:DUF4879 domain-containing protein [Orenia marismortui]|uniref:Putative secreted protein (Por secretion system target) n=1 Tax=Orenia marismortui TaxID=46469 RepID=A0A4V3GYF7_9FIRM|nr:DUF4879 domain-containing protein [Orenia marismortui]TDX51616.1 putative secreted protein (Por secretion system target) [Orenia marismortui]